MGMSSSGGSGKSRVVMSEINVTPLVDVMLVLLIIFMITAPMMQQGLEIELPETAASGVSTSEEPFVLIINRSKRITAGGQAIPKAELRTRLAAIFEKRPNKQIYLQADKSVDYGFVAETMAEIRAAGIHNIGLVTLPKSTP
ncbi:MAG: biopolymer transporter ExbD [Bdellovibrionales bacterium]|jgi:biopolymer transport protein TolR|nr:biopolymer transporter ExbD [Bdellovibrionales bacterium]